MMLLDDSSSDAWGVDEDEDTDWDGKVRFVLVRAVGAEERGDEDCGCLDVAADDDDKFDGSSCP